MAERYLRAQITYADTATAVDFAARVIRGASAIQRGIALGHGGWIDKAFVKQVAEQGNAKTHAKTGGQIGLKSRFTHPSLSGDGLGNYLGRQKNFKVQGDRAVGDLHFGQSADPQQADMIMKRAAEDPQAFGMSIVFEHDRASEDEFAAKHRKPAKDGMAFECRGCHESLSYCEGRGESMAVKRYAGELKAVRCSQCGTSNDPTFQSPDADNLENLPHWRLRSIHAVDVVDEPAANADGFLSQEQELVTNLDVALRYATGLTNLVPNQMVLGRYPGEKAREFLTNWLSTNGLVLVSRQQLKMATCPTCGTMFDPVETEPDATDPEEPGEGEGEMAKPLAADPPANPPPTDAEPPQNDPPVPTDVPVGEPIETQATCAVDPTALGAISYRTAHPNGTPLAPKSESWDGEAERTAATVEDLHIMSSYVEDGKSDLKGAYKLPHHKAAGEHAAVWRGVAAAASREPQTNMPESARPGVRSHLGDHYREFDETPPWERSAATWTTYTQMFALLERRGAPSQEELATVLRQCGFEIEADALQDVVELKDVAIVSHETRPASNGQDHDSPFTAEQIAQLNARLDGIGQAFTEITGRMV
jgi:hypothetical protein